MRIRMIILIMIIIMIMMMIKCTHNGTTDNTCI